MRMLVFVFLIALVSCQPKAPKVETSTLAPTEFHSDFVLSFGSCNNQLIPNPFWNQLKNQHPDVWIWGGDVIYSDTEDMQILKNNYAIQKQDTSYLNFVRTTTVMGTWDDHDYGVNDGGNEYRKKKESQQLFLDFLDVKPTDVRRKQEGLYYSQTFTIKDHTIKVLILDTRYFRSALTIDETGKKRYQPNRHGEGTFLGEAQWQWLQNELTHSTADYHVIMSSVQVLSSLHGFESWGNMPHELERLEKLILESQAKGVILLSGDRHISEISVKKIGPNQLPLPDFTSSGMTHSYTSFSGEDNPYRVSKVIFEKSYGIIRFDFQKRKLRMEMWGEENKLLEKYDMSL
jgi:alkaline phosphatase D